MLMSQRSQQALQDSGNRKDTDSRASSSSSQQKTADSGFVADGDNVPENTVIHSIKSMLRNAKKTSTRKCLDQLEKKHRIRKRFFFALAELDPANFEKNAQKSAALFNCPSDVCEKSVNEILHKPGKEKLLQPTTMNDYQLILDNDMDILPGEEVVVGEDDLEWDER